MRKILAIALILTFVITIPAGSISGRIKVWQVINITQTTQTSTVPILTIVPKRDRILGVSVLHYGATTSSENFVSLIDTVPNGTGGTVAEVIAEAETDDTGGWSEWFPYPITVWTQLNISQGAFTEVLVYYSR